MSYTARVTAECALFHFQLCPFNRRRFQQTTSKQRVHHSEAHRGQSGHAVPVHETHKWHLGAGGAEGAGGEPQLHGGCHATSIWSRPAGFFLWSLDFRVRPRCPCCAMLLSLSLSELRSLPPLRWHATLKPDCQSHLSAANFRSWPLLRRCCCWGFLFFWHATCFLTRH